MQRIGSGLCFPLPLTPRVLQAFPVSASEREAGTNHLMCIKEDEKGRRNPPERSRRVWSRRGCERAGRRVRTMEQGTLRAQRPMSFSRTRELILEASDVRAAKMANVTMDVGWCQAFSAESSASEDPGKRLRTPSPLATGHCCLHGSEECYHPRSSSEPHHAAVFPRGYVLELCLPDSPIRGALVSPAQLSARLPAELLAFVSSRQPLKTVEAERVCI